MRLQIIENVRRACSRGELCRAIVHEPKQKYRRGELIGYGALIGERGSKGSGVMVASTTRGLNVVRQVREAHP